MLPRSLVALAAVAFLVSGCAVGGTKTTTVTVTTTVSSPAKAETASVKYFGTPVSITQVDRTRYVIEIKPEFFLVGVTANVAFAAQQHNACQPEECPAAEDDRFVLPAGTQNLVFELPAMTTGTVLTLANQQMHTTKITAAQLAGLVGGAPKPKLMEPLDSGLWLTVDVDRVTSFAQQFEP